MKHNLTVGIYVPILLLDLQQLLGKIASFEGYCIGDDVVVGRASSVLIVLTVLPKNCHS